MVYLHFPMQLTEEEEMLQKKYQKLRRKKKALLQLKAPKQEVPAPKTLQCNLEAKPDAKEVAKKLLKSGAISAIKVENKERQGFKRPKALERKRNATEKSGSGVSGYQPFSSSHSAEDDNQNPSPSQTSPSSSQTNYKPAMKKLYESFVSSHDLSEPDVKDDRIKDRDRRERDRDGRTERPKQGNTVYVRGFGVTQELLQKTFQPLGNIVNISMEMDKNCGFVTFEKMEIADKAIKTMNHIMTDGVQLSVSLARKQPLIPAMDGSTIAWGSLAANSSQKGGIDDSRRSLVSYDDL